MHRTLCCCSCRPLPYHTMYRTFEHLFTCNAGASGPDFCPQARHAWISGAPLCLSTCMSMCTHAWISGAPLRVPVYLHASCVSMLCPSTLAASSAYNGCRITVESVHRTPAHHLCVALHIPPPFPRLCGAVGSPAHPCAPLCTPAHPLCTPVHPCAPPCTPCVVQTGPVGAIGTEVPFYQAYVKGLLKALEATRARVRGRAGAGARGRDVWHAPPAGHGAHWVPFPATEPTHSDTQPFIVFGDPCTRVRTPTSLY